MPHLNIAIIGASGGIGSAMVEQMSADPSHTVYAFSRSTLDRQHWVRADNIHTGTIDFADEATIQQAAQRAAEAAPLDLVIVASGILHSDHMAPEKALRELSATNFEQNFLVNTIGPALTAKHFLPKLHRDKRGVFAALSARVGSIADNRLGGWYAYRASKAALNMLIKTTSIEIARRQKHSIVVGLHPGTVDTQLSEPFQARVPKEKLFSTEFSASRLLSVIEQLATDDSGKIFAWDGNEIPY